LSKDNSGRVARQNIKQKENSSNYSPQNNDRINYFRENVFSHRSKINEGLKVVKFIVRK